MNKMYLLRWTIPAAKWSFYFEICNSYLMVGFFDYGFDFFFLMIILSLKYWYLKFLK